MSRVFMVGDLHFGHWNVANFRTHFANEAHHRQFIMDQWNSVVTNKRDVVYVLGDAAFTACGLESIKELTGRKVLIRGNHDKLNAGHYLAAFNEVFGIIKYKGFWLSHCPIHPQELRGFRNIHGHVHYNTVPDKRYINVCLENIGYAPILFEDIVAGKADYFPERERFTRHDEDK